jgi:hypothetical protein
MHVRRCLVTCALLAMGMAGSVASSWSQPAGASTGAGKPIPSAGQWQRVTLTAVQGQRLRRLYASYRRLPLSDIGQVSAGSVRAAARPASGREWAMISFLPSARAPQAVTWQFQDGAGTGIYTRMRGQRWKMAGLGGEPAGCGLRIPSAVRTLWRLTSCHEGSSPPPAGSGPTPAVDTQQLANIAQDQVGISDTPASTSFLADCNPYTTLVGVGASSQGCGEDPHFQVLDENEEWCADNAKYVWEQAGVTSDLGTLDPGANSFTAWGYEHGESVTLDGSDPAVGDAIVFYPAGTTQKEIDTSDPADQPMAYHVGIVVAVNPDGTPVIVNGDFLGSSNISVQYDNTSPSLQDWADSQGWQTDPEWVYVSPQLSTDDRVPAAAVDQSGNRYVFWRNTGGGLEEAFYTASTGNWTGPDPISGMGQLGSEPTVAVGPQTSGGYHYQYVFWKGTGADPGLYEAYWNGSWHGPVPLGDGPLGSQPTAGVDNSGNIYVFWENTGNGLEETYYNGSSWDSPQEIKADGNGMGPLGSSPSVAVNPANGYQYVFWQGTGSGSNLYEAYWNGSWHGPVPLGDGPLGGPPSAAADSSGNIYVFWESPGSQLYEVYNDGSWDSPNEITAGGSGMGPLGSAPTVGVDPSNSDQYVFWMGPGSDHGLYEAYYDSSWNGPVSLGDGPLCCKYS